MFYVVVTVQGTHLGFWGVFLVTHCLSWSFEVGKALGGNSTGLMQGSLLYRRQGILTHWLSSHVPGECGVSLIK